MTTKMLGADAAARVGAVGRRVGQFHHPVGTLTYYPNPTAIAYVQPGHTCPTWTKRS
jgi:hypothetical protein